MDVAARTRLGTVQIAVRVDPDGAAGAVDLTQACERSQGDRVVTTQHDRNEIVPRRARNELGDPLRGFLDLGQKAGALVPGLRCLRHRSLDVSQIHVLVPQLVEAGSQTGIPDRGRTHVNATATGPQVEIRADDGDFSSKRLRNHGKQG